MPAAPLHPEGRDEPWKRVASTPQRHALANPAEEESRTAATAARCDHAGAGHRAAAPPAERNSPDRTAAHPPAPARPGLEAHASCIADSQRGIHFAGLRSSPDQTAQQKQQEQHQRDAAHRPWKGQENSPGCRKNSPCKASDAPDRSNTSDLPGTDLGRPGGSEGAVSASEAGSSRSHLCTERQLRLRTLPQAFCWDRVGGIHSRHRSPWTQRYPLIDGRRQAPAQERIDAIPTVLTSSDACLEAFRNVEGKRVIPIGLASLYAIHCLDPAAPPPSGSLFFRCHSTGVTQLKLDDDQLIRNLRGLPDRFHPIRICAYWRDWDLGEYEPFLSAGFQVVGAAPTAILCSSGGICTCSNHTVMCSARESAAMSFMPAFWEDQPWSCRCRCNG